MLKNRKLAKVTLNRKIGKQRQPSSSALTLATPSQPTESCRQGGNGTGIKTTTTLEPTLMLEVKPVSKPTEGRERMQLPGLQIGIKKGLGHIKT